MNLSNVQQFDNYAVQSKMSPYKFFRKGARSFEEKIDYGMQVGAIKVRN